MTLSLSSCNQLPSQQDEAGAAAVLAVELDDALGGAAKQLRQVQGSEAPEFVQVRLPVLLEFYT